MIDVTKIQTAMADQQEKEWLIRVDAKNKARIKLEADEKALVETINRIANGLQGKIEVAIAEGKKWISICSSDECIRAIMDRYKFARYPDQNAFYEKIDVASDNKYDNPFHAIHETLKNVGMTWSIEHTDASRDPEYRYDAYDMLVLDWKK